MSVPKFFAILVSVAFFVAPIDAIIQKAEAVTKQQAIAECKKRYGDTVFNALIGKDGKSFTCYWSNPAQPNINDPLDVRDFCKKKYGPLSRAEKRDGKWRCIR